VSGEFYVFRCKNCGQWGVKEIRLSVLRSVFKCVYCMKSCKVKTKNEGVLSMVYRGPWCNPVAATRVCQALNNLRGEKRINNRTTYTYKRK